MLAGSVPFLTAGVLLGVLLSLLWRPIFASENSSVFLAKINQFRISKGRLPVKSNPSTCRLASLRAKEIAKDFSHDGFYNRVKNKDLPYPTYKLATENLARTKRQNAVELWIDSPSHAQNLLKNTSFACVENYGYCYAYEGLAI